MKLLLFSSLVLNAFSCLPTENTKETHQTADTSKIVKIPTSNPNESKRTEVEIDSTQSTIAFIGNFLEHDFYRARQELTDQGKEHGYKFTDVQKLGNMLKYSLEIPGIEGFQEYSCIPKQGESTVVVTGDKDMAKLYFDQTELSKEWDRNEMSANRHVLEIREDMKEYPIQTHITVTYLIYEDYSIVTMRRVLLPKHSIIN